MTIAPKILNQLIWNQVISAFSWNRSQAGDVMVMTEPVMSALAHAVAQVLAHTTDVEAALAQFADEVRDHLARLPDEPAMPPLAKFATGKPKVLEPVGEGADIIAFKRTD
ncbi:hypothetical protein sos41_41710 [Alphaproteobacteria bacterium SO-S41]|nr:hypothetical protein sos41_41710 [Alphaproteobacteria bacterium SO-S41]